MNLISRSEARKSGAKRYFTGALCIRGHLSERISSNGACLACTRERQRKLYADDPLAARNRQYKWREENRDRHLKNHRDGARFRYAANPEKYREKLRERRVTEGDKWREYDREYRADPVRGIAHLARVLTASAIKRAGFKKGTKTQVLLGCSLDFFRAHIERQFLPGMTWENRALWHIDHIVPVASAKTLDDVISLCHFTNLRPLWAKENLSKSAKQTHLL